MSEPFSEIAGGLALPMLRGPLRGSWWFPASGGKLARLLGTYETRQASRFAACLRPGDEVLDAGAAAGFYTLLAARRVGLRGRVAACEPDPTHLAYLRAHLARNGVAQAVVVPCALSDHSGRGHLSRARGRSRLCDEGGLDVNVRTLDEVARAHGLELRCIKLDVEGAELAVLRGGEQTIRSQRPLLFLSTHEQQNPGVEAGCRALLESWGYALDPIEPGQFACTMTPDLA